MASSPVTIVALLRAGIFDPELAALLWLLADGGVPIHVASDGAGRERVAGALRPLARDAAPLTAGPGGSIEEVLRQPVPIRPASGVVVVLDRDDRVAAVHLHRPPLRDAAGHVRPQGPAVLATWEPGLGSWEHFAWGVTPELAAAAGRRAGDFEAEVDRRRDFLSALAASDLVDDGRMASALAAFEG